MIVGVIESWNEAQNHFKNISLRFLSPRKTKLLIYNKHFKDY